MSRPLLSNLTLPLIRANSRQLNPKQCISRATATHPPPLLHHPLASNPTTHQRPTSLRPYHTTQPSAVTLKTFLRLMNPFRASTRLLVDLNNFGKTTLIDFRKSHQKRTHNIMTLVTTALLTSFTRALTLHCVMPPTNNKNKSKKDKNKTKNINKPSLYTSVDGMPLDTKAAIIRQHMAPLEKHLLQILAAWEVSLTVPVHDLPPPHKELWWEPIDPFWRKNIVGFTRLNEDRLTEGIMTEIRRRYEDIKVRMVEMERRREMLFKELREMLERVMAKRPVLEGFLDEDEEGYDEDEVLAAINGEVVALVKRMPEIDVLGPEGLAEVWREELQAFEDRVSEELLDDELLERPLLEFRQYIISSFPYTFHNHRIARKEPIPEGSILWLKKQQLLSGILRRDEPLFALRENIDRVFESEMKRHLEFMGRAWEIKVHIIRLEGEIYPTDVALVNR